MLEFFSRTEMLLGEKAMEKLKKASIAVFGIGGVGSYTVEALARSAVGKLSLFDNDKIAETNINRQIIASSKTIGEKKVEVMKNRIKDINPNCEVYVNECFYSAENANEIDLNEFDYVVDAIDTVSSKLILIEKAYKNNVPIISCMGAGNKLDPTRFEIADIYETSVCPLARVMRKELKLRGIENLKVVYSKESPVIPKRFSGNKQESRELVKKPKTIPGSVAYVPSVAGLIIASEVIKEIIS